MGILQSLPANLEPMPHSHIIGIDDAPFPKQHRGDVKVIGSVFTGNRLDGVVCGKVRRDGINATDRVVDLILNSRFYDHLQLVMLQGIALAGFNVVDIWRLKDTLDLPVLVICRRQPDFSAIARALLEKVPGGKHKWRLIKRAGEMEPAAGVYIQRAGIDLAGAVEVIRSTAIHSTIPEPLRTSHIIASGVAGQSSRHRV